MLSNSVATNFKFDLSSLSGLTYTCIPSVLNKLIPISFKYSLLVVSFLVYTSAAIAEALEDPKPISKFAPNSSC